MHPPHMPDRYAHYTRDGCSPLCPNAAIRCKCAPFLGIALGLTVVTGIDGDGWRLVLEKIEGISPMTASWLDYSRLCAPGTLKTLVARGLGQRRLQSTGTAKCTALDIESGVELGTRCSTCAKWKIRDMD